MIPGGFPVLPNEGSHLHVDSVQFNSTNIFRAPPNCLLCTNSEQTDERTLSLESSLSGGVDQPFEKNAKLFAFLNIFSYISKANIGTNIQTDGEALKGRIIFTLLEQFHLDLFKNIHLRS